MSQFRTTRSLHLIPEGTVTGLTRVCPCRLPAGMDGHTAGLFWVLVAMLPLFIFDT